MNLATQYIASNKILIFTFLFVIIGVVFNDYHKTIQGRDEEIYILRIILASIVISMLMHGISDKILSVTNESIYYFLCIAGGWANYSVYDLLDLIGNNGLDGLVNWFKQLAKLKMNQNTDDKIKELEDRMNEIDNDD